MTNLVEYEKDSFYILVYMKYILHVISRKKFLYLLGFVVAGTALWLFPSGTLVEGFQLWTNNVLTWVNAIMRCSAVFMLLCAIIWALSHNKVNLQATGKKCQAVQRTPSLPMSQLGILNKENRFGKEAKIVDVVRYMAPLIANQTEEMQPELNTTVETCLTSLEEASRCLKRHGNNIEARVTRSRKRIVEIGEKLRLLEERVSEERIHGVPEGPNINNEPLPSTGFTQSDSVLINRGFSTASNKQPVKCNLLEKVLQMNGSADIIKIDKKLNRKEKNPLETTAQQWSMSSSILSSNILYKS